MTSSKDKPDNLAGGARPRGQHANSRPRSAQRRSSREEPRPRAVTARWVATSVLHRVEVDAAYAARALDAELAAARLSDRDARLATEIVYGTLRQLPLIDARLDAQLARGRPDPFTLAALRAATYQALFLSRVPDHAIVQETVSIVKIKRGEGLGKLTNAVLRRVVADRPREPLAQARLALPSWLEANLVEGLGAERADAFLRAEQVPPLALRCADASARDTLLTRLREERPEAELWPSLLVPQVLYAQRAGDPRKLPGYSEGAFAVQDAGAGLVGALVGAQPGERVLDACAGRGGKTLQLLALVGAQGHVTAVDIHARKLTQLKDEARRCGIDAARLTTETIDLSVGDGGLTPGFDRVLVDAPCTGLGTLMRRPEIALRITPEDPQRMADLQLAILEHALQLLRPGGILVYAVCSGSLQEGRGVADRLEARQTGIRRVGNPVPGVSLTADDDSVFRIGPWLGQKAELPDVYQVVRWTRLDSVTSPV
ncbi:MAG TPA: transcription antitermination factor NusB [Polyangiales bacterium]